VAREIDNGQELYELLIRNGVDRAQAESYVVQEGLGAHIGADRIPALAASITAHVEANLEWVAKEGTKISVALAVGGALAPVAGTSALGVVATDALAGVAYQGTEDLIEQELSGPLDYVLAAGVSVGGGAVLRALGGSGSLGSLGRSTTPEHGAFPASSGDAMIVTEGAGLGRAFVPNSLPRAVEQGRDAAGRFTGKAIGELAPGADRALRVQRRLEHRYGAEAVQREQYLRSAGGERARDPVTGESRRLDFVVVEGAQVRAAVEVTSRTAGKVAQAAKEVRIRRAGGTYIKDRVTGQLLDLSKVPTRIIRVK
jgi:hypothetical protein